MFELLPQVGLELKFGSVQATVDVGPALLVTHDCDLDKPVGSTTAPRIARLQFLPLLDLSRLTADRQALVRALRHQPPEPIYVGEVPGVGEAFGLLSEMYSLPAGLFELALERFDDHPEAEPGAHHLIASSHANRVGRLSTEHLELLQQKIIAFYTRKEYGGG